MSDIRNRIKGLEYVDADKIKPNPKNWRKHPKSQHSAMKAILGEVGIAGALLVYEDGDDYVIIDGHLRHDMIKQPVPVLVTDLNEDEANKILATFDPISAMAETDKDALAELLASVDFDSDEINQMLEIEKEPGEGLTDPDDVPEDVEPTCRPGDLWKLGDHRLLCGDATSQGDVDRLMDGVKADMVFTDPPYLMDFTGGIHADGSKSFNSKHGSIKNDKMNEKDGDAFLDKINTAIKNNVKGSFYISFYRHGIDKYYRSLWRVGLKTRSLIIWSKGNHTLSNSDYMSYYEPIFYGWVDDHKFYGSSGSVDIWNIKRTQKNTLHPTMKPVELCSYGIGNSSNKGDSVLDLFGGSGSTLIACQQTGRKCYMMELDAHYCDVIIKRWEDFTGLQAELVQ